MEITDSAPNSESEERASQPWGNVTDPNNHDPNNFRYLIHGINPAATSSMGIIGAITQQDQSPINKEGGDQTINLFREPERLAERVALSCSLIDNKHFGTWGQAGLIIEVPPENVYITSSSDVGAIVMNKRLLENQARQHHLLTAEQLLTQTSQSSYNEVVMLANKSGKKVRLAGFFYKATENGGPMDEGLAKEMQLHATRLQLPIVAISEPNPYRQNQIIKEQGLFSVNLNGNRYMLEGFSEDNFTFYDQRQLGKFISPEEMEQVIRFLRENNVDPKKIEQFQTKYMEADKKQQEPKIKYDEKGNIFSIEKRSGYGKGEIKKEIRRSGYTSLVNTSEESQEIRVGMADSKGYSRPKEINRLSPQEVENIVQEALDNASYEEKTKIRAWYESFKENHAKHYEYKQSSGALNFLDSDFTKFLKRFPKDKNS